MSNSRKRTKTSSKTTPQGRKKTRADDQHAEDLWWTEGADCYDAAMRLANYSTRQIKNIEALKAFNHSLAAMHLRRANAVLEDQFVKCILNLIEDLQKTRKGFSIANAIKFAQEKIVLLKQLLVIMSTNKELTTAETSLVRTIEVHIGLYENCVNAPQKDSLPVEKHFGINADLFFAEPKGSIPSQYKTSNMLKQQDDGHIVKLCDEKIIVALKKTPRTDLVHTTVNESISVIRNQSFCYLSSQERISYALDLQHLDICEARPALEASIALEKEKSEEDIYEIRAQILEAKTSSSKKRYLEAITTLRSLQEDLRDSNTNMDLQNYVLIELIRNIKQNAFKRYKTIKFDIDIPSQTQEFQKYINEAKKYSGEQNYLEAVNTLYTLYFLQEIFEEVPKLRRFVLMELIVAADLLSSELRNKTECALNPVKSSDPQIELLKSDFELSRQSETKFFPSYQQPTARELAYGGVLFPALNHSFPPSERVETSLRAEKIRNDVTKQTNSPNSMANLTAYVGASLMLALGNSTTLVRYVKTLRAEATNVAALEEQHRVRPKLG